MIKKEGGFLIPLALFIVVALGALTLAMSRMTSASKAQSVGEGISTQAFYSAESGAQLAMHRIYFNTTTRAAADTNCSNVNGSSITLAGSGFGFCTVSIACSRTIDAANTTSLYTVESTGQCGSGDFFAERIVSVSAYMRDDS